MGKQYKIIQVSPDKIGFPNEGLIAYLAEYKEDKKRKATLIWCRVKIANDLKPSLRPEITSDEEIRTVIWEETREWFEQQLIKNTAIKGFLDYPDVILADDIAGKFDLQEISLPTEWTEIKESERRNIVFISCGQVTDEEKQLGKDIMNLVRNSTPFDPYFADFQSDLKGVSQNIFSKLNEAIGFITVMHHRGTVTTRNHQFTRASVWLEQEIAIASFIEHTLSRQFHVAAFEQKGIKREGLREVIILNPHPFERESEVLDKLREILPTWKSVPATPGDLSVVAEIEYEVVRRKPDRHDYKMLIYLRNRGKKKVEDFRVDVSVPREVIKARTTYALEVPNVATKTHRLFRVTHRENPGVILYQGNRHLVMTLEYYIDDSIHDVIESSPKIVEATVWSDDMEPNTLKKSLWELQQF